MEEKKEFIEDFEFGPHKTSTPSSPQLLGKRKNPGENENDQEIVGPDIRKKPKCNNKINYLLESIMHYMETYKKNPLFFN